MYFCKFSFFRRRFTGAKIWFCLQEKIYDFEDSENPRIAFVSFVYGCVCVLGDKSWGEWGGFWCVWHRSYFFCVHNQRYQREVARPCWGKWGLKEYKWKGTSLVCSLGVSCRYKRLLSCLGCSCQPSTIHFFLTAHYFNLCVAQLPSNLGRQSCRTACLWMCGLCTQQSHSDTK